MNEEECNEFLLMGYTTSPKATQNGNKLLVIMSTPLTGYCQIFADYAWEKGWRKAAIVVTLGAYGDDWRETFKTYWKKLGGTITADKPANYYTKTDFTAPLTAAVATNPDVMLIGGPSSTTALVIEQARNMGYKGGFLLIDQARMDYVSTMLEGTSMMEGTIGLPTLDSSLSALVPAFDKKYRAIYKRPAAWESIVHYGSIFYLAAAIQAANTIDDVYAIRDALPRVFPLTGERFPFEVYGISSTGRIYTAYSVQTVQNGKFTPASEVYVWWTKNQAELDKLQKINKYKIPLKRIKEKIGKIE
jgi:branched-chain amino acid transport system substrate-binding protein